MKTYSVLVLAVIGLFIGSAANAKYSGGTGEPNDPYRITTPEDLNDIGNHQDDWDKYFILVNDVNIAQYTGTQFNIIGNSTTKFTGVFDGNGHKIWNFTWSSTGRNGIGLFGYVGEGGQIKNLGMENVNIDSGAEGYIGALVGLNAGTISACYSTGNIRGRIKVGGLVGLNVWDVATITDCYSTANILCQWQWEYCGGLVGGNSGTIINCYSTGMVSAELGGRVGGLDGGSCVVVNSFWNIETSGQSTSGGGKGKTTTEMKMASTYYGWGGCGNEGVWTIDEGNDYPRLAWEGRLGQPMPKQQLSDSVSGSGIETDPYLISTAEQLNLIGLFPCEWDKHFELVNDVNLSSYTGRQFNIIGVFNGVFDGKNHKIWNFTLNYTGCGCRLGLFGLVGGLIKNLGLENVDVNALNDSSYVGALVGYNILGTIRNCYASGRVAGTGIVGGLVGHHQGWMEGCYSEGTVLGVVYVGGLVGANYGEISLCCSLGSVSGEDGVGGLVGDNDSGGGGYSASITNCYSTVSVRGNGEAVGGLVGWNSGPISNSYSTGLVSGDQYVEYVGGLVGRNDYWGATISSFWDVNTSDWATSAGGTPKTTVEMKTQSTFTDAGWDFVEIWGIGENQTYPFLRTEPAGDSNHDKKVNLEDLAILASHWLEGPP